MCHEPARGAVGEIKERSAVLKRILIKNAAVASVDPAIGELPAGDILIEGERILDVRPGLVADADETIDATGCIAMPGMIDAHRHLWEGGFRGVTSDWSILDFVGNVRFLAASFFRPEDMYATALLGSYEALNAGVTTVADYCHNVRSPDHAHETLRGIREAGGRSVWGFGFVSLAHTGQVFSNEDRLAFLKTLKAEQFASDDSLVRLAICPREVSLWGDDLASVKAQFAFAREAGMQIFMHNNALGNPRYVMKLAEHDLLSDRLTLVHMGSTDADEWEAVGAAGTSVCFTPETEYQMAMGWPSSADAARAGVNICIGTDMTANNSADMFFPTRMFMQVERSMLSQKMGPEPFIGAPISCAEALEWATIKAARAVGLADVAGSLTPGKYADIVLLRADGPSMAGWDRRKPATAILQQGGVNAVDTVIVGGRFAKRDGRLLADTSRAVRMQEETVARVHALAVENGGFEADLETIQRRMAG